MFIAPILVMWLLSVLLGTSDYRAKVAAIDLPSSYVTVLKKHATVVTEDKDKANKLLADDDIDAILSLPKNSTTMNVKLEGSNSTANAAVLSAVADTTTDFTKQARAEMQQAIDAKKAQLEQTQADIQQQVDAKKAQAEAQQAKVKQEIAQMQAQAAAKQAAVKAAQTQMQTQVQQILATLPAPQRQQVAAKFAVLFQTMSAASGSVSSSSGSSSSSSDLQSLINSMSSTGSTSDISGFSFNTSDINMDFNVNKYLPIQDISKSYLHGSADWKMFDFFGPIFIALFIFVFVFITSGMSLVNEKSAGTMERFLASPVRSWEILGGYSLGFGALSAVQVAVILGAALWIIGFPNEGNVWYLVLIAISLAIASVTLGLLVSGMASSAFQVIQLMLVFVVPQILLSGIFDLSGAPTWMQVLSKCLPLTYGSDAMTQVMLRGQGWSSIWVDLTVVWSFAAVFFLLASIKFRKKRAKRSAERAMAA